MKKLFLLVFLLIVLSSLIQCQSRVFDTVFVKKAVTLDSVVTPSNSPAYGKGRFVGKGMDGVLYQYPNGTTEQVVGGSGGVGDTTFKWSTNGSAWVEDSIRFIAGAGMTLTRSGYTLTITNNTTDSARIADTSRASYWSTKLRGDADSALIADSAKKVASTYNLRRTTPSYTAETDKFLRADSTWVTPTGVGDITAVNTNLPLSGGVTSGSATLSIDTSNATYGLTTLYRNSLRIARSDTATYSATRAWVATTYPGDITGITVGNGLTGGGTIGAVIIGVDSTVLATQYDLSLANGDISSVTVGNGLTGGGTTGALTIGVDSTVLATQYDLSQTAGDITSVVAGAGLSGGATSGAATLTIDTTSSRIATQYDITQIDSTKVPPYSLANWNIDSAYTIYTTGLTGKIPYFVTAESISFSNWDYTLLDTTGNISYSTVARARNASNIDAGTLPAARLPSTGVTIGSYTNSNITVDTYGRITSISSGGGGGGGSGNITSGENAFSSSATSDTIAFTGTHSYDQITTQGFPATPNALPVAGDLMNVYPDTNRFIVNRAAGTTSGLGYRWIKNVGTFAPPSAIDVATDGDDSLIVSWTAPATTTTSTARPLDSIAVAWGTSGYADNLTTAENVQYTAKAAVKDTIIGLVASTLYYVNVFSYSYADEASAQSVDTRDTCTTGVVAGTVDTIRADAIAGLVAWYEGRFITGKSNGEGITSWIDHSSGGRTLDTITGKTGSLPIYYSSVSGQFNTHPAVGFNALNVNDSCGLHSTTVVSDSFSGSSAHAMTIVAVMNIPDSAYKQTNYCLYDFSNSSNYQMDIWGGNYRTATLKTMKYALSAPAPDSADTRSTNLALATYTLPAHIWTWRYDGDSLTQWIDATKIDSNTTQHWNQSNITFNRFSVGYQWVLATKDYYGAYNVAALIIYKGEVSDANLAILRARLKAYYATP